MYSIDILFAKKPVSLRNAFSMTFGWHTRLFVSSNNLTESLSVIKNSISYYTEGMIVIYKDGKRLSDWSLYDCLTPTISIFVNAVDALRNGQKSYSQQLPDQPTEVIFSLVEESVLITIQTYSNRTVLNEFFVSKEFFLVEMPVHIEKFKNTYDEFIEEGARW